ncbi:gamma-glutamyltranspeptidase/glutathione hydrolase [Virgibacillus natechei]|uniref:Glutathione hydrolase proenzyme n=1 Tax=Virgibacillus natechei TaxID=1216297 RepID=A0ABS4IJM8_9BACI|nr:gamma-glutamyltransferase [Virgibacillus natechei]MBP1970209.1 gamma-glutamyltranspeptidase/glutathione hydrolase [Virgibacillus natechei]UZD12840.1 gamma-glutamyltransferase [Virgibacillus natechei]
MGLQNGKNDSFLDTGRPVVEGKNGAVTSPHYLATQTGKRILDQGGHAVEAAIAVNSVLCVVIPHMAGLGGDLFALVWDQHEKEVKSLNGSGKSGSQVNREVYKQKGLNEIPERGPLAVNTVPGTVDGWWSLHQHYGKLEWSLLFEDAIHYAKEGFPITEKTSSYVQEKADLLNEQPETANVFFKNGRPILSGELLVQPNLAWAFEQISKEGRDAFYKGDIADKIIASMEKHDGLMVKEDFTNHTVEWEDPISTNYRGYEIYQVKPNTQGIAVLMMLNMLEKYDLTSIGDGTPDYYHLMAEVAKLKFRFRDEWVTDSQSIDLPYDTLLSKSFSSEVNEHFSWNNIFRPEELEELPKVKGSRDTAYLSVVDKEGNSISLIQSIFHEFGSGFMPEGVGFFLQNRGSHFSLDPNHPNSLEPNKRTFHTIIPGMALKDGKPYMLFGAMGGEGQPQTQCAMLTRVIDFGYNIQQAIEAPRWLYGKTWGEDSSSFNLEGRVTSEIIDDLKKRGHEIEMVENYSQTMGHAQGVVIDHKRGVYSAGADLRGDGIALCW